MRARLYSADGSLITALDAEVVVPGWAHTLDGPGAGSIEIFEDHPNYSDLTGDRIIACLDDEAGVVYGFVLIDSAGQFSDDANLRVWTGPGVETKLGTSQHPRAVIIGDGDTDLVTYGWVARDYAADEFTDGVISGGHIQAQRKPSWKAKRFPDPIAEWIISQDSDTPTGSYWVRHTLDTQGAREGVELWVAGKAVVYLNGDPVLESDRLSDVTQATIDLTGDDVLAVELTGRAAWTLGVAGNTDDEDDTNDFRVLYRSTTGAPYSVDASEVHQIVVAPESPPYPWGSDYPSTGPDNLQGVWTYSLPGKGTTAAIQWDADASDFEDALEALSGIEDVEVTGSNTTASPFVVTFLDPIGAIGAGTLDHHDLRHSHGATYAKVTTRGKSTPTAAPGAGALAGSSDEPDGVTHGYVATRALAEAQARGCLPGVTLTFSDTLDTNGDPWDETMPMVSFRPEQFGDIMRQCCQYFETFMQVGPALNVYVTNDPGLDLTATVDVNDNLVDATWSEPSQIDVTHVRALVDGGAGWVSVGGTGRREVVASFGTARESGQLGRAARSLARELSGVREGTWTMGPTLTPRPYADFTVGDLVSFGPWDCRVLAILPSLDDERDLFEVRWRQE